MDGSRSSTVFPSMYNGLFGWHIASCHWSEENLKSFAEPEGYSLAALWSEHKKPHMGKANWRSTAADWIPGGTADPRPGTARWANHSGPRSPEQSVQSHSRQIMTRLGGCEQLSLSLYFRAWHCSLGLGRVQKAWVFTGSCVQRPVGKRCKAGRAAARPLPPRACSTLPVVGGAETVHQTEVRHCWAVMLALRTSTAK